MSANVWKLMKQHGLRLLVASTAIALPLSAAAMAPASAAPTHVATRASAPVSRVAPRVITPKVVPASVLSGPSRWAGAPLKHPRGGGFPRSVRRWANITSAVMVEHRIPLKYLSGVLAQIQQESGGDPKAINRYDSNAAAGHPSKGLLQVIAPTYRTFAKKGFRSLRYQTVPYTNIWAALNYVKRSYGMGKFKRWARGSNEAY